MANGIQKKSNDHSAPYIIKIKGKIREDWSDWMSGMEISTTRNPQGAMVTTLSGTLIDQAALRGLLCRIWDLNLTILSVSRNEKDTQQKGS